MRALPRYPPCFVCGRSNAAGLDVTFYHDGQSVTAELIGTKKHTGYPDVIHGGVLAALLDEAMGWAVTVACGRMVHTWELTVRYQRPLPPGTSLRIQAQMHEDRRRYQVSRGTVEGPDGQVYARGEGKYRPIDAATERKVLDVLERDDGSRGIRMEELSS